MKANLVSVQGRSTGRYYVEVELVDLQQNVSVRSIGVGLTRSSPMGEFESPAENGIGVAHDGGVSIEGIGTSSSTGGNIAAGDVFGFAVDFNEGDPNNVKVWISLNGVFIGGDPEVGTGWIGEGETPMLSGTFYMGLVTYAEAVWTQALVARLCAAAVQLNYAPPTGFLPWEDS